MRQLVTIHAGQAGCQIGSACWELFCLEHGIAPDGTRQDKGDDSWVGTFFEESSTGRYVPRSLFVDLEPTVIDEIHGGAYRDLFNSSYMVEGKEDAASNFARGYYTVGKQMIDYTMYQLSKIVEKCDGLQSFLIFHSLGGGTGSGFTSLLLERMSAEFGRIPNLAFPIHTAPMNASSTVEPYNEVLSCEALVEHSEVTFMYDNDALYDICTKKLKVPCPTFTNINRLVAQSVSSLTASLRFQGALNVDMNEFQTNLVPYPRVHFAVCSQAPLESIENASHNVTDVNEITAAAFSDENLMLRCNPHRGRYVSCCLLYRGDVSPQQVNSAIRHMKQSKTLSFVNWCPTGFKVGLNYRPATCVPGGDIATSTRSLMMVCNNTSVGDSWKTVAGKFDLMYAKRAFVHWYVGEGMEESEMVDARENVRTLEKDYQLIEEDERAYEESTIDEDPFAPWDIHAQ